MKGGLAFFKKELAGILKTYKIWLLPLIFVFLGISSPVAAKFTPALIKAAMQADEAQRQVFGQIKIPEPTAKDAYDQWFKNLSQVGILATILISMGLISGEKAQGTLAMVVTKPISRSSIVVSKFLAYALLLFVSALLGLLTCYLYTALLFGKAPLKPLVLSTAAFSAFILLVLSLTLLASSLTRRQIAAGGLALLATFIFSILASIGHGLDKYSPGAIPGLAARIASDSLAFSKAIPALGVTLAGAVALVAAAALALNRQEI